MDIQNMCAYTPLVHTCVDTPVSHRRTEIFQQKISVEWGGVLHNSIEGVLRTKKQYCVIPPLLRVRTKGGAVQSAIEELH